MFRCNVQSVSRRMQSSVHFNSDNICLRQIILNVAWLRGYGWRRGSVIRTSVSGCLTFSDLCLIYGWHVNTLWVKCPLWVSQPGQSAFNPSGVGKWVVIHVITWIMGCKPLNGKPRLRMAVWSQVQSPGCAGLAYDLEAVRPLCPWHNSAAAAAVTAWALYKCYAFTSISTGTLWHCLELLASRSVRKRPESNQRPYDCVSRTTNQRAKSLHLY